MNGQWSFELPWDKPLKGLSANHRVHWAVKNQSTQTVRSFVAIMCRPIPKLERIAVSLVWFVPDKRRRDPDNLAPLFKAVADGIAADKGTSAHLVPDDAPQYCVKIHPEIVHEPGCNPRFEVTITDLSNHFRPDDIEQLVKERDL